MPARLPNSLPHVPTRRLMRVKRGRHARFVARPLHFQVTPITKNVQNAHNFILKFDIARGRCEFLPVLPRCPRATGGPDTRMAIE
ncbi:MULTISPECIES: hypothetical protein [unclassified Burkholderia]|uniref:hypothetical protein n=1 Tax=unclassified Burkholderia TaxID=2613784 RepID=UPI000F584726|nr:MULTISPECIES: hypothetical protein [unclassified Burkholderia]RQR26077.1 hypothetical protein DIE22_33845 [Burkholderia sp. Bp9142]